MGNEEKEVSNAPGVQALTDLLLPLSASADIYELHERQMKLSNCRRFPYKDDPADMTPEERERVAVQARTRGVDVNEALRGVCASPYAWYSMVLPSTSRQNYYEKVLVNYLRRCGLAVNDLPNGGKNSKYMVGGVVHTKATLAASPKTKTIDLEMLGDPNFYFVAKHTTGSGGGQDNQFRDALNFISQQNAMNKDKLVLVLDGDYYQSPFLRFPTRIDYVRNLITESGLSGNTWAGTYSEVPTQINEWLSQSQ